MGGGALETNCLTNGETESSLHRQFSPAPAALDNSLSDANDAVADHDVVCVFCIVYPYLCEVFVVAS